MKPRDLPALRSEMVDYLNTSFAERFFKQVQTDVPFAGSDLNAQQVSDLWIREKERWSVADLYFVNREMTDLAQRAATTLPATMLRPEDLPSPSGIMVFEKSIETRFRRGRSISMQVVVWSPLQTIQGDGVWLGFYTLRDDFPEASWPFIYDDERLIPYNVEQGVPDWARDKSNLNLASLAVHSSWLLMKQKIAAVESRPLERQQRRALERKSHPADPVRVITIRGHEKSDSTGESDREYRNRWVVRGHWRKQWYPTQNRHVPIWIAPHIKGPDGAPVLGGEKVYAWTR